MIHFLRTLLSYWNHKNQMNKNMQKRRQCYDKLSLVHMFQQLHIHLYLKMKKYSKY